MGDLTYKKAGVDIDAGNRFVGIISPFVKATFRKEVVTDIGGFGALFKPDIERYKNPILVSGTDGVGTKLKIAFMMDRHDTVGIDLVAMCVNDILTSGAEPLFFLDYFAIGRLRPEKAAEVVRGICNGCSEAGCSLIGGETAEMPDFYGEGEYDLSGFAVGIVDEDRVIDGSGIKAGDVLVGLASSGLHSNGFSLVRRLFFDEKGYSIDRFMPELGTTLGEELIRPTRIYVKSVLEMSKDFKIKGMAHITGGGITENLPRILPSGLKAVIKKDSWQIQPVFSVIQELGNVSPSEMFRVFNMGIGFILVFSEEDVERAIFRLKELGERPYIIGFIDKGEGGCVYV